jgi:hypothetical protein
MYSSTRRGLGENRAKHMAMLLVMLMFVTHPIAQCSLRIVATCQTETILLNKVISYDHKMYQTTKLKVYLSTIRSKGKEGEEWNHDIEHWLYDLEDSSTHQITLASKEIELISMNIGLDSLTNVSENFNEALDPIHGMYWSWNSGYIHFKWEGIETNEKGDSQPFEFHIGGYLHPYQTLTHVECIVPESKADLVLQIDLSYILSNWEFKAHPTIMMPGKHAVEFSRLLPALFSIH